MSLCQEFTKALFYILSLILIPVLIYFLCFIWKRKSNDHFQGTQVKIEQFGISDFNAAMQSKYIDENISKVFLVSNYDNSQIQKQKIVNFSCELLENQTNKIKYVSFYKKTKFTNNLYIKKFPFELNNYSNKNDFIFNIKLIDYKLLLVTEFNLNDLKINPHYRRNIMDTIYCD